MGNSVVCVARHLGVRFRNSIRFRSVALDVYGTNDTATVVVSEGKGLVYREGQKVVMVFGAHAPIETGMTTVFGYWYYVGKISWTKLSIEAQLSSKLLVTLRTSRCELTTPVNPGTPAVCSNEKRTCSQSSSF